MAYYDPDPPYGSRQVPFRKKPDPTSPSFVPTGSRMTHFTDDSFRMDRMRLTPISTNTATSSSGTPGVIDPAKARGHVNPALSKTNMTPKRFSLGDINLDKYKPFVSNLVNSFRKPPKLDAPPTEAPVTMQRVNFDDQRAEISRQYGAADRGASQSLDENTATAVKGYNLGRRLVDVGRTYETEKNTNAGIANQEAALNSGVGARNAASRYDWSKENVSREVAMQREQSENIANAMDKSIAIDGQRADRDLDFKKFKILSAMDKDGVMKRLLEGIDEEDPLNFKYQGSTKKYDFGGTLKSGTILKKLLKMK